PATDHLLLIVLERECEEVGRGGGDEWRGEACAPSGCRSRPASVDHPAASRRASAAVNQLYTVLVVDLDLDVADGVAALDLERDALVQRPHEDLHL
ncbi:hypothetical protein EE612_039339, partial [Oryza sativa]